MAGICVYIHFLVDKQYSYFTELQVVLSSKIPIELCRIKTPNSSGFDLREKKNRRRRRRRRNRRKKRQRRRRRRRRKEGD